MIARPGGERGNTDNRVRRLLAWYPRGWRVRYGDEFAELLAAEYSEQGRSRRRSADIIASGLRARLAGAGLAAHPLDRGGAARASLAALIYCGGAFAMFGTAMWSQLAVGLQWAIPYDRGVTQALDLESAGLLMFAVAALLGLATATSAAIATAVHGNGRTLIRPVALAMAGAAILVIGGRHFANAWPGTGGHLLAHQALVPGGIAAFGWSATMGITSYVAHPGALAAFPVTQLAWMTLSLAAAWMLTGGLAQLARRVDRSPRAIRSSACLGYLAGAAILLFLTGALRWLWAAAGTPLPAFHVGVIDVAGFGLLAACLAVGGQALRQAERAAASGALSR